MSDTKDSIASAFGGADTKLASNDASAFEVIKRASGDQATEVPNTIETQSRWSKVTNSLSRAFSTPPSLPSLLVCGAMTAGNYAFGNRTLCIIEGAMTAYGTYRYLTDVSTPSSSKPVYIKPHGHTNEGESSVGSEASRPLVEGTDVKPEALSAE